MAKLGTPYIINNANYTLDYTKTTYGTAQTVVSIITPNYPIRLQVLSYSVGSTVPSNWLIALTFSTVAFVYSSGQSQYSTPSLTFTLCGNVPTDYIDLPANTLIKISAYMNGSATANDTLSLTIIGKQVIEAGD